MSWTVRNIEPDEYREYMRVCGIGFGDPDLTDDDFDDCTVIAEVDRNHVAVDGDAFVGTTGAYSFDLTVPGGATLPMAGVTDVGVLPTHRRRGVLTSLMLFQIDAIAERGDPIAGLTASEGGIYRRFGYGIATRHQTLEVETPRSTFLRSAAAGGTLRMIDGKDTATTMGPAWDAHRTSTPGGLSRTPAWWELWARDRERWRNGGSRLFRVVHEDDRGMVDGYAAYRFKSGESSAGEANNEVLVDELVGASPQVEAALWRHCLDIDLTIRLKAFTVRIDDPIKTRFADRRCALVTSERDMLWLRFIDVPRCLEARTYADDGGVTLGVVDDFRSSAGGTFRLEVDAGRATCAPTDGEPEVVLDTADLAAIYLGDETFARLRGAGLVAERADGAVARADSLFRTDALPYCLHGF
jgi:predicted acetyltransferase